MSEWGFEPRSLNSCFLQKLWGGECAEHRIIGRWGLGLGRDEGETGLNHRELWTSWLAPVVPNVLWFQLRHHLLQEAFSDFLSLPRCPPSFPHLWVWPCALLSHGLTVDELSTHWFLLNSKLLERGATSNCFCMPGLWGTEESVGHWVWRRGMTRLEAAWQELTTANGLRTRGQESVECCLCFLECKLYEHSDLICLVPWCDSVPRKVSGRE